MNLSVNILSGKVFRSDRAESGGKSPPGIGIEGEVYVVICNGGKRNAADGTCVTCAFRMCAMLMQRINLDTSAFSGCVCF
ncbi:hypothetical protein ZHAS_00004232 [Anopheles sinensis]|uniref:Uncharacterized protein n=1 Tax=Anopheles sinensis TaxID=74873 RepID=A0A084VGE5_ANOSI|nr:hypothetical protein ZHAS_00004232 [Anopheles sinensis]